MRRSIFLSGTNKLFDPLGPFDDGAVPGFLFDRPAPENGNQWTDSDQTTLATMSGDSIGAYESRDPNNNLATQAISGRRPVVINDPPWNHYFTAAYQQHWSLSAGAFAYSSGAFSFVCAVKAAAQSAGAALYSEGSSAPGGSLYIISSGLVDTAKVRIFIRNSSSTTLLDVTGEIDLFDDSWSVFSYIDTGSQYTMRIDGEISASGSYTRSGTMSLDLSTICALNRAQGISAPYNGAIIPVVGIGCALASNEIVKYEAIARSLAAL